MKPFYRMLTHAALILQSLIILYLWSSQDDHGDKTVGSHQSCYATSLQQNANCNTLADLLPPGSDSIKTILPDIRPKIYTDFMK